MIEKESIYGSESDFFIVPQCAGLCGRQLDRTLTIVESAFKKKTLSKITVEITVFIKPPKRFPIAAPDNAVS